MNSSTSDTPVNSLVLHTRQTKHYQFEMTEKEAIVCLNKLKEESPELIAGFPKGSRISLRSLENTRDLGGFKTMDNKLILPHKLIRSGELYHVSLEDQEILTREYKVSTVIDFRTDAEKTKKPDDQMEGVRYIENAILDEETLGITREKDITSMILEYDGASEEYMKDIYRNMALDDYASNRYAMFFQYLLEQEEGAVLWHCSVGKDRAGLATAYLLTALGVPRGPVYDDYMKTNLYIQKDIEYMIRSIKGKENQEVLEKNIRTLLGVKECYLQSAFDAIDEVYGSFDQYLSKKLCMTTRGLERLRKKYLL